MRADPTAQLKLLDVQELDSRLDVLRHRLAHLPEEVELKDLALRRKQLDDARADTQVQVDDLTREQRKADQDVETVKVRRAKDQERLDKGLVGSPKDLERLQHELVSLDRRISDLEDAELEIMAVLEDAQRTLDQQRAELAEMDAQVETLRSARDRAAGEIRAEVADVTARRDAAAADLPEDLTKLYERLREQKGGVGAALLRARRCEGCSLELNAADLGVIAKKPSDEVVRCEECSRILVRTGESGL